MFSDFKKLLKLYLESKITYSITYYFLTFYVTKKDNLK